MVESETTAAPFPIDTRYGGVLVAVDEAGKEVCWMRVDFYNIEEAIEDLNEWLEGDPDGKLKLRIRSVQPGEFA